VQVCNVLVHLARAVHIKPKRNSVELSRNETSCEIFAHHFKRSSQSRPKTSWFKHCSIWRQWVLRLLTGRPMIRLSIPGRGTDFYIIRNDESQLWNPPVHLYFDQREALSMVSI
jgi:hypothetical protein